MQAIKIKTPKVCEGRVVGQWHNIHAVCQRSATYMVNGKCYCKQHATKAGATFA